MSLRYQTDRHWADALANFRRISGMDIAPDGTAINPVTGQRQLVYARTPNDALTEDYSDFRFDNPGFGYGSLEGMTPGYYADNDATTFDNFMERVAMGGLAALGGVAGAGMAGFGPGAAAATGGADFAALGGVEGLGGVGSGPASSWANPGNWWANAGSMTDVPIQWDAAAGAGEFGSEPFVWDAGAEQIIEPGLWNPAQPTADAGWMDVLGGAEGMGGPGSGMPSTPSAWYERLWDKVSGRAGDKAIDAVLGGGLSAILRGAPAAVGAYGANQQAEAYKELANKYMGFGEPSRERYEASFQPGFTMENEPGYKDALALTTKETLHSLSPSGNPAGSPNAWQQTLADVNAKFAMPALNEYRRQNMAGGGLAALTSAAPGAAGAGIKAEGGVYDALGAGMADIFNPPKGLAEILRELRRSGY